MARVVTLPSGIFGKPISPHCGHVERLPVGHLDITFFKLVHIGVELGVLLPEELQLSLDLPNGIIKLVESETEMHEIVEPYQHRLNRPRTVLNGQVELRIVRRPRRQRHAVEPLLLTGIKEHLVKSGGALAAGKADPVLRHLVLDPGTGAGARYPRLPGIRCPARIAPKAYSLEAPHFTGQSNHGVGVFLPIEVGLGAQEKDQVMVRGGIRRVVEKVPGGNEIRQ